jgi:hypothetical protein
MKPADAAYQCPLCATSRHRWSFNQFVGSHHDRLRKRKTFIAEYPAASAFIEMIHDPIYRESGEAPSGGG